MFNNSTNIYRSQLLKFLDESPVECYNRCLFLEPGLGEVTDDNLEEYIVLYQMCKEACGITGENHSIELK